MSTGLIIASAIVVAACAGFVAVGSVYHWNVRSRGYARWTRAIGVVAVLSLSVTIAVVRRAEPAIATLALVGGVVLAVAYTLAHRRLSERARLLLGPAPDENETPSA